MSMSDPLRDVIEAAQAEYDDGLDVVLDNETPFDVVERHIRAWLSEPLSLAELEVAVAAFCGVHPAMKPAGWSFRVSAALRAARSVLLGSPHTTKEQT
jgi:hypothetical protein